jgi:predicted phosphodiesterase
MNYYKKLFLLIPLVLIYAGCLQSNEKESNQNISKELITPTPFTYEEPKFKPSIPPLEKQTIQKLKVAFLADQGINKNAKRVLQLIKDENTDMVIHAGDFGYGGVLRERSIGTALDWDSQISEILGSNFPYFGTIGNHDEGNWSTYQKLLQDRVDHNIEATCIGNLGITSSCEYKGLFFVLSGVGELGNNHDTYIKNELQKNNSIWQICTWHKNQRALQIGGKKDAIGWEAYEECRKGGAIIATGHEHTYSRTKTLVSTEKQTVHTEWSEPNLIRVAKETENQNGSTFVFVSGIAGQSIQDQERCKPITYPYGCNNEWAKIYTSDQNASPGALFITFHIDDDPTKAYGYFKNIHNEIIDEFIIYSFNE